MRWFDLTDYASFDPGVLQIAVTDKTSGRSLTKATVRADASTWTTLVLRPGASGQPELHVQDDTYDYDPTSLGSVTVWNAVPSVEATISFKGVPGAVAQSIPLGESRTVGQLPISGVQAILTLHSSQGANATRPLNYTFPLDFRYGKQMAIVVLMDRYGDLSATTYQSGLYYNETISPPPAMDSKPGTESQVP
jgi:hypothetical protein